MYIPVQSKRDLITGLKTRTIAGRPNWDKVFRDISNNRCVSPPYIGQIC